MECSQNRIVPRPSDGAMVGRPEIPDARTRTTLDRFAAPDNVRFRSRNGLAPDIAPCPKSANSGTSQRHSISAREFGLGLDRKLGPVGSGGSNLMRRLVKAQPNKCARLCRSVQI
jgi:hypothetical protein